MPSDPPYTHNLARLSNDSGLSSMMSEAQNSFVDSMIPHNIEARYPSYQEQLLQALSPEVCQHILTKTQEFTTWIKQKLSK